MHSVTALLLLTRIDAVLRKLLTVPQREELVMTRIIVLVGVFTFILQSSWAQIRVPTNTAKEKQKKIYQGMIQFIEDAEKSFVNLGFDSKAVAQGLRAEYGQKFEGIPAPKGAIESATRELDDSVFEEDEKSKARRLREERLSRMVEAQSLLNRVYQQDKLQLYLDFQQMKANAIEDRWRSGNVAVSGSRPTGSIRVAAAALSIFLGGKVSFEDDAGGAFFNYDDPEQLRLRPRVLNLLPPFTTEYLDPEAAKKAVERGDLNGVMNHGMHELDKIKARIRAKGGKVRSRLDYSYRDRFDPRINPGLYQYQEMGGIRYLICYQILARVFDAAGLLTDYGIKNLRLRFDAGGRARVNVSGDTLTIQVGYRRVIPKSMGYETFNVSGLAPSETMTNWWIYREYDPNTVVRKLQGKHGLPSFHWKKDVKTIIVSQGGAVIGSGGGGAHWDPVMVVTPTRDKKVQNAYYQVRWFDQAGIQRALLSQGTRISARYPRNFILQEAVGFVRLFDTLQNQMEDVKAEEERLLAEVPEKDDDGKPIPLEVRKKALAWSQLYGFFQGEKIRAGRKALATLPIEQMSSEDRRMMSDLLPGCQRCK